MFPFNKSRTTFDPMPKVSNEVVSSKAQLACKALDSNMIVDKDSNFTLSFSFIDPVSQIPIHDINWSVSVSLLSLFIKAKSKIVKYLYKKILG